MTRMILRWVLAVFFAAAGYAHLTAPTTLLAITPDWVPFAPQVIFVTGLFEFAAATALLTKRWHAYAGSALTAYSVCVWPANIKHAVDGIDIPNLPSSWWYHGPRLVLQPVIVCACLYAGEVLDWPFRKR
jgi:uncharacterized membrane protein